MGDGTCSVAGCSKASETRGWCAMHYARWRLHGDVTYTERPTWGQPDHVRFFAKVDADGDCWQWTGCIDRDGYAKFLNIKVHRWAWTYLVGPIPEGLELDHLCRNRSCVNPDHLEPVSRLVNIHRSYNPPAMNARKTHCPKGHPYAGENLLVYTRPGGTPSRYCRACDRARPPRRRRHEDHDQV
jgi:hypothetical protein